MSDRPITEPDSFVAQTATENGRLALGQLVLVGVFSTPESRRALLRAANGDLLRVEVGDTIPGGMVLAIAADAVHLARPGRSSERLGLPEDE